MRVISLNSKANAVLLPVLLTVLAALALFAVHAAQKAYQGQLLVRPADLTAKALAPEVLDEFSGKAFQLTYEIRQTAAAQTEHRRGTVAMIGTNYAYPYVMNYVMSSGGFFTEAAQDAYSRFAVLNESAAYQLFGSIDICGAEFRLNNERFTVAGVIQDQDEDTANVYVPAYFTGGSADTLMAKMDDRNFTQAYVVNALKEIGIHENNYAFINLERNAHAFLERFYVAALVFLIGVLVLAIVKLGRWCLRLYKRFQVLLRDYYFWEAARLMAKELFMALGALLLQVGFLIGAMLASLAVLRYVLGWQSIAPLTAGQFADFEAKLQWLLQYRAADVLLFACCMLGILLFSALNTCSLFLARNQNPGGIETK